MNEWMNFLWGQKYSQDICQSMLVLWPLRKVSLFVAWGTNTQGLLQGVSWNQTALPSWLSWPSCPCGETQYHMSFFLPPLRRHQQLRCFHKLGVCPSSGSWDLGHTQTGKKCCTECIWSVHREKEGQKRKLKNRRECEVNRLLPWDLQVSVTAYIWERFANFSISKPAFKSSNWLWIIFKKLPPAQPPEGIKESPAVTLIP